ncbi:MAG TPA: SMC-Scp complex subunit ScpB [Gammaproteobacteria bacterium]|nr:SMC-Scp complex subunit ScpB [Gammaproteobacteria bacterium]
MSTKEPLAAILEALLFSAARPLSEQQLLQLFTEEERPVLGELRKALQELEAAYADRAVQLVSIASGYQFQSKIEYAEWIRRLWEEKPARYSRALLETLALIAYRQPITRGEIEEIRGVSISPSIFKTLLEDRNWIRVVGHRDVPGRPALYATTKAFLDYFGLKTLDQLPPLPEILALADIDLTAELADQAPAAKQMQLPELFAAEVADDEEVDVEAATEPSEY